MALSAFAICSLADLKRHLSLDSGTEKDGYLEDCINWATERIEQYTDRQIVKRATLTEFHTMPVSKPDLYTLEWPIIAVTEVAESDASPRDYTGAAILTTSQYQLVKPAGRLVRLDTGLPVGWQTGWRAIRVKYDGGYADTAAVPDRIRSVAARLAGLYLRETERGQQGVSSMSDALGNVTRMGPARITPDMERELASERRMGPLHTGERDS